MTYESVQGQDKAIAQLKDMCTAGRVPSALLFLGPHHVGKRLTARALTAALNCPSGPVQGCGQCPSCRKVAEGVHPDLIEIAPDGQFIKIDQIREVTHRLSLIPYEARKRVVILSQAEAMNLQAANAFLKTLEEPPDDTLLVLCAASASARPETIISRCLPVRFVPLADSIVGALLATQGQLSPEELAFAIRFAQGTVQPGLAAKAGPRMMLRDDMIQTLGQLDGPAFIQVSEKCAGWSSGEDWKFVLAWLETWFRDLALLGSGMTADQLVNPDREEQLRHWLRRFPPDLALQCHRRVLGTRQSILINANKTLALEALWLDMRRAAAQRTGGAS